MLVRQGNWTCYFYNSNTEEPLVCVETGDDGSCTIRLKDDVDFQNLGPEASKTLAFFLYEKCFQKKQVINNFESEMD